MLKISEDGVGWLEFLSWVAMGRWKARVGRDRETAAMRKQRRVQETRAGGRPATAACTRKERDQLQELGDKKSLIGERRRGVRFVQSRTGSRGENEKEL